MVPHNWQQFPRAALTALRMEFQLFLVNRLWRLLPQLDAGIKSGLIGGIKSQSNIVGRTLSTSRGAGYPVTIDGGGAGSRRNQLRMLISAPPSSHTASVDPPGTGSL